MQRLRILVLAALIPLAVAPIAAAMEEVERKDAVVVNAPTTDVEVSSREVTVAAPFTDVKVDKENRRVRIRVPYFSGDISW
jgi:hypothetical protein